MKLEIRSGGHPLGTVDFSREPKNGDILTILLDDGELIAEVQHLGYTIQTKEDKLTCVDNYVEVNLLDHIPSLSPNDFSVEPDIDLDF